MKVSESKMDANVTQLFQQKMMLYCWMIKYYKTTGIVKKNAATNILYLLCGALWQIIISVMNLWSYVTPRVIFLIVICW